MALLSRLTSTMAFPRLTEALIPPVAFFMLLVIKTMSAIGEQAFMKLKP
jgi:hypothetical protein